MDRREAIGLGLAGALAAAHRRSAQEHETGYLPGDSQEFVGAVAGHAAGRRRASISS